MKVIDLRKLNYDSILKIRKEVVRLRQLNIVNAKVAKQLKISEQAASRYYVMYLRNPASFNKAKKIGLKKIGIHNERKILHNIMTSRHNGMKYWTRDAVKIVIEEILHIKIAMTTLTDYMKRWGLLTNESIAIENNISINNAKTWLRRVYSGIEETARNENAEILWVHKYKRIYFPSTLTKKSIELDEWKIKCYKMEIVAPYGTKAFILSPARYDAYDLIKFLKKLIQHTDKKVYLILNIPKIYPIKPVKMWLKENDNKIEVYYVPQK